MARYCTYIPSKGKELFSELKKEYGYGIAKSVFLRAINPSFIENNRSTLSLDAEGIPTYKSLITVPYIQGLIGNKQIIRQLEGRYPPKENTLQNYQMMIADAYTFNTKDPLAENLVATVEQDSDTLNMVFNPKSQEAVSKFENQYKTNTLNTSLANFLKPLGITIGELSAEEIRAGKVGETDFNLAKDVANGFVDLIKVANNIEGYGSITEEAAHTIIGLFINKPFIQRAINSLAHSEEALKEILGNTYDSVVTNYDEDMELVAEEALGHLLRDKIIKEYRSPEIQKKTIIQRALDWLINQFKNLNADRVTTIIHEAETSLNDISKKLVEGTLEISKDDVAKAQRNAKFNALSEEIDRSLKALKTAELAESKRYKMLDKGSKLATITAEKIANLRTAHSENADIVESLFKYARGAVSQLRSLSTSLDNAIENSPDKVWSTLRTIRMFTQSYGAFISDLKDAILDEEERVRQETKEGNDTENKFLRDFEIDGQTISIGSVIKDLNDEISNLNKRFFRVAAPAFAESLKPFTGEITVINGEEYTIESLLKSSPKDIGFFDKWLDSGVASNDPILQGIGRWIQDAHNNARNQTIDDTRHRIFNWMVKAEKLGITSFGWMFEKVNGHKTGNYISSVNHGQYEQDVEEMEKSLVEKYGKNPSGAMLIAKQNARKAWHSEHSERILMQYYPKSSIYANQDYEKLSDDQKALLEEYLDIKESYDKKYPPGRTSRLTAIQNRKSGGQRLLDSISSPSTFFQNLKEMTKSAILDMEDDDQTFGDRSKKGLTDFAGNEFLTLPVLYTHKLANPDELSEDVVESLMAYAFAANTYEEMDKIVDPLEVGRAVLSERDTMQTRGGKQVKEDVTVMGVTFNNPLKKKRSYFEEKLNDIYESQVYQRYLKDEGAFNILGKKVNRSKLTSLLLRGSAFAQLGFNWLSETANVTNGIAMQNIEAFTGQFFNRSQLLNADKEYAKALPQFIAELGARVQNSKLALFYELFNIKQEYGKNIKRNQRKNLILKFFGANIAYLGQECGDHWLYGRTAIARALRKRVLLDGKEMSLWDALQVQSTDNPKIKELNWKDIKELDGSPFNRNLFTEQVHRLNDRFFGVYNEESANAANRISAGKLLQQYRKWMRPLYKARFGEKRENKDLGWNEEGWYRTIGRISLELARGERQLATFWDDLTEDEKFNIKRTITEVVQLCAVWALGHWVEWPDDKDRPWAFKFSEYLAKRLAHELGSIAPSPVMLQEMIATVRQPIPSVSVIEDTRKFLFSVADPRDWITEVESGPYKGLTIVEKNALRAPILRPWKQIERFTGELDASIKYLARP